MGRSPDPAVFPHTVPNDRPPEPGDLYTGAEGIFAVCYIGPENCTGLLAGGEYVGIVDIPLGDMTNAFPVRVLVKESLHDIDPSSRGH